MFKKMMISTAMMFLAVGLSLAGSSKFINVDITQYTETGENKELKMRIPVSMLDAMAPAITETLDEVSEEAANHNIDFQGIWNEIRNAGPTEFVAVNNDDVNISVKTTESDLRVVMQHEGEDINITVPLALGDALMGGDTFDMENLLETLESFDGDLITIEGSKVDGRVWVD